MQKRTRRLWSFLGQIVETTFKGNNRRPVYKRTIIVLFQNTSAIEVFVFEIHPPINSYQCLGGPSGLTLITWSVIFLVTLRSFFSHVIWQAKSSGGLVAVSLNMFRLVCKRQSGSLSQLDEKVIARLDVCLWQIKTNTINSTCSRATATWF